LFSLSMANIEWMNFYQSINKWARVVGKQNIKVFRYSKNIVKDFIIYFKIEFPEDLIKHNANLNQSIPNELLNAIKQKNINVTCPNEYRKNLKEVMQIYRDTTKLKAPSILFSVPEQKMLDQYYKASNIKLAKEYLDDGILFEDKEYKPVKFIPLNLINEEQKKCLKKDT